jgi:type IV pilus assembly protein PilB
VKNKKRLGEMLVEAGLLTDEQLKQAVIDHKRSNMKLGQFLVREGIMGAAQITDLISRQLKIQKYYPDNYPIDMHLADLLPIEMVQKYQAIPLARTSYLVTMAMTDPTDINALDAIEVYTNMEVEPVICTYQEWNHLMGSLYGTYSTMGGMLERMEEMEIEQAPDGEKGALRGGPRGALPAGHGRRGAGRPAGQLHSLPGGARRRQRRAHQPGEGPRAGALPRGRQAARGAGAAQIDAPADRLAPEDPGQHGHRPSRMPQDGRFTIRMDNKEINIRASTIPTIYGENMVLRLLDTSSGIYSLEELGMSERTSQAGGHDRQALRHDPEHRAHRQR